jgi:hypothetical protein
LTTDQHDHEHGPGCGHTAIRHDDHVDHLHDGELHHHGDDGVASHAIPVSATNPADCTPEHDCVEHASDHAHGPDCDHEEVPHGDHIDGPVEVVEQA